MTSEDHSCVRAHDLIPLPFGGFLRNLATAMPERAIRSSALILGLAFPLSAGALKAEETGAPVAAFREEFKSFDRSFWFISDGWTNGPHQNCEWSKHAVGLADGVLTLSFLPGGEGTSEKHFCGEIQTKATYHHGTFEARIKSAKGSGLNAAFFTYIGPVHNARHDEIDVEILTRDTESVWLNIYVDGEQQNGKTVPVDPPTDEAFHTYAFTWAPGSIRWFIDGKEVHRATKNLPVTPQKIYLSHWGSDTLTDWMGPFTTPSAPVEMKVAWVAFTPLGAPCQFPQSVLCQDQ